jgi:hypothetical protein
VDLSIDTSHCGTCDNACPPRAACASGACVCPQGLTLCGSVCADAAGDDTHCGGCKTTCTGNTHCVAGQCTAPPAKSIVFVSSVVYPAGALGGLFGADAKCQALAQAAALPGTYRAWLSDAVTDAASRIAHWPTPYVLSDGTTRVADDWTGLTSGALAHAIDRTETGGPPPTDLYTSILVNGVWTNTNKDGTKYSVYDCGGWNHTSAQVSSFHLGDATRNDDAWTLKSPPGISGGICGKTAAIYCIGE